MTLSISLRDREFAKFIERDDGQTAVAVDVEVSDKSAGGSLNAEYKSPTDFTATYTSSSTITLSNIKFSIVDSSQLVYVKVIKTDNTSTLYTNGSGNITLTISSNVMTIYDSGSVITTLTTGDIYEIGINEQDKGFDSSTNSILNSNLNPQYSRYTDSESLIGTPTEIGSSFADMGAEIDLQGYNTARLWATLDIGSSTNVQLKILGKHTSAGTEEYPLYDDVITVQAPNTFYSGLGSRFFELTEDSDQLFCVDLDCKNMTPYIQVQFNATSGADMAEIDGLYITKGYK